MTDASVKSESRKKRMTAPEVQHMQRLCRERLLAGFVKENLQPGVPIAGMRSLCSQYDMPFSVVRNTLAELKKEGIIVSIPRSGMRMAVIPKLPKTLEMSRFAMVGYMDERHPESKFTRPALICEGMERLLNEQGGILHFFNTSEIEDFESIMENIKKWKPDGIIYMRSELSECKDEADLALLITLKIPLVGLDLENENCNTVTFDDDHIGRIQAEHVIGLGHREVCVLGMAEHKWSDIRIAAVNAEFTRRGIKPPDIYRLPYKRPDPTDVEAFVASHISKYSACIAVNDSLAGLLIDAAEKIGILIPENLALIGADDLANKRHYNLTTVQLAARELGFGAFEILKEKLLAPEENQGLKHLKLKCPLIIRRTTANYKKTKI